MSHVANTALKRCTLSCSFHQTELVILTQPRNLHSAILTVSMGFTSLLDCKLPGRSSSMSEHIPALVCENTERAKLPLKTGATRIG